MWKISNIKRELVRVANKLDKLGMHKEADFLDKIIGQ